MSGRHLPLPSAFESGQWGGDGSPCPPDRVLASRMDGEYDAAKTARVDAHLDACPFCAREYRRLEGLSGLLKAADLEVERLEPPARLASRILADVGEEAHSRRLEVRTAARWRRLAAASVLLALATGAFLGREIGRSSDADAAALSGSGLRIATDLRLPPTLDVPARAPSLAAAASTARLEAGIVDLRDAAPTDLSPLHEEASRQALARFAALLAVRERLGEDPWYREGYWLSATAVVEFDRLRRWERTIERRRRLTDETITVVDPADVISLHSVVPLPARGEADGDATVRAFLGALPRATIPAREDQAGLVVWALPSTSVPAAPAAVSGSDGTNGGDAADDTILDLTSAVASNAVRLLEDEIARPGVLWVRVESRSPILVLPGELITGGAVDRAVARGALLPAGWYRYSLPCVPVARTVPREERFRRGDPRPFGAVAGPSLRASLHANDDAEAILALVRAQLRGAGLDVWANDGSLLSLYDPASADVQEAARRAKGLAKRLFAAGDVGGFVVADIDGRLQGIEWARPAASGPTDLFERLLTGYLVEARARPGGAVRSGARVETALSYLQRKSPLLSPAPGAPKHARLFVAEEPHTGLVIRGLAGEGGLEFVSGLLP